MKSCVSEHRFNFDVDICAVYTHSSRMTETFFPSLKLQSFSAFLLSKSVLAHYQKKSLVY